MTDLDHKRYLVLCPQADCPAQFFAGTGAEAIIQLIEHEQHNHTGDIQNLRELQIYERIVFRVNYTTPPPP